MKSEIMKTLKSALWALILVALLKIYEHQGYYNPITLCVIVIIFSLWILFRIELNEEVIDIENNNKTVADESDDSSNPQEINTPPQQSRSSTTGSMTKEVKPITFTPFSLKTKKDKSQKKLTKFSRLARSRSTTPVK
jgi:hypothetical protein